MSQEKIPPEKLALLTKFADRSGTIADGLGISYVILAKVPGHPEVMMESGGAPCEDLEGEKAAIMSFFMQWAMSQAAKAVG